MLEVVLELIMCIMKKMLIYEDYENREIFWKKCKMGVSCLLH